MGQSTSVSTALNTDMPLTVENVRKSSRQHKRCGTSFLFFVMIVSIIFCFFITAESQVYKSRNPDCADAGDRGSFL